MRAYYQDKWVTIYHGDCREVLPQLDVKADLVLTDPDYKNQDAAWFGMVRASRVILTPGIDNIALYPQPKWVLCWYKPSGITYSRCGGFNQWEPVLLYGDRFHFTQDYFYQIPLNFSNGPERHHIYPKPVNLWDWLILGGSKGHELILDPFLGSGTTCCCAKKLHRHSIGIEIEESYCEMAARRCSQEVMELVA